MAAEEGKKAPDFSLDSSTGKKISLKDMRGKWVVLYFYPKDNTSGCTKEACDFRDRSNELKKRGAVVLGVSPDSLKSHKKFIDNYDLNFPLLADEAKKTLQDYGVWVEKSMYGRKYMGVERSTFLINPEGKIAKAWRKVSVTGHGEAVVKALDELREEE